MVPITLDQRTCPYCKLMNRSEWADDGGAPPIGIHNEAACSYRRPGPAALRRRLGSNGFSRCRNIYLGGHRPP